MRFGLQYIFTEQCLTCIIIGVEGVCKRGNGLEDDIFVGWIEIAEREVEIEYLIVLLDGEVEDCGVNEFFLGKGFLVEVLTPFCNKVVIKSQ